MVDGLRVVQIIMNISVDDECAIPSPCFFLYKDRRHDIINHSSNITIRQLLLSPMCIWQTSGAMTAQPFVLSRFRRVAHLPWNVGNADATSSLRCVWPQARSADDLTSSMVIFDRRAILVAQKGGRQRRRAGATASLS